MIATTLTQMYMHQIGTTKTKMVMDTEILIVYRFHVRYYKDMCLTTLTAMISPAMLLMVLSTTKITTEIYMVIHLIS